MKLFTSVVLLCTTACSAQHATRGAAASDTHSEAQAKKVSAQPAVSPALSQSGGTGTVYPSGLPMGIFGSSYAMNQPIDQLPVDTRLIATGYGPNVTVTSKNTVDAEVRSSPEGSSIFGLVVTPNFPITVVNSAKHPELMVHVTYTQDSYAGESDSIDPTYAGPKGEKRTRLMPVRDAVIEPSGGTGDAHMTVPDLATMIDYELYHVTRATDGSLTAQQVSVWDMKTGKRISDNGCDTKPCTSANAGGTPNLAGIVRQEEVQWAVRHNLPDIGHAIRVTYNWSRQGLGGSAGWFVAPATHAAGRGGSPIVMGMRLRIPASLAKPAKLSAVDNVLWNTLAKYGMVVDDNGGTGFLIGDENPAWGGNHNFSIPSGVMARSMEVVNTGCWNNANGTNDITAILSGPCQNTASPKR